MPTVPCPTCSGTGNIDAQPSLELGLALEVAPPPFEEFWKQYPRKVSKATALKRWLKMSFAERRSATEALPAHVQLWSQEGRGSVMVPHAVTWLNQERWNDEITHHDARPEIRRAPGVAGLQALLAERANEGRSLGAGS